MDRNLLLFLAEVIWESLPFNTYSKTDERIPLILVTPGLKQPKEVCGKEIEALQALSSNPPVIKSEDLQSLVHEIASVVEEAKT